MFIAAIRKLWRPSMSSVAINHIYAYPAPTSLNASYTFGSLAGLALAIQLISGLLLTMHYVPSAIGAFESVEHIMRDVIGGPALRYIHANGASFFFFNLYLHIARSLYYKNYIKNQAAWFIGIIIFFAVMATAFIGYVLPWGQMSFWGATVITNLFSVVPFIGEDLVVWLWGGFGVGGPTLNRFYTLHFLLPFIILALVVLHIYVLHNEGSTTPVYANHGSEVISFGHYFLHKDLLLNTLAVVVFFAFVACEPNMLNHPDNYIAANPMQTPPHIVPEWYFLPFYAILRTIPSKGAGVAAMGASIAFLFLLPSVYTEQTFACVPTTSEVSVFILFCYSVLMLGYLGGQPITFPYTEASIICTWLYVSYVPLLTIASAEVGRLNYALKLTFLLITIILL